jgi:hypothetical protein
MRTTRNPVQPEKVPPGCSQSLQSPDAPQEFGQASRSVCHDFVFRQTRRTHRPATDQGTERSDIRHSKTRFSSPAASPPRTWDAEAYDREAGGPPAPTVSLRSVEWSLRFR